MRIWPAPATMSACNPRGARPTFHRFRLAAMTTIALVRGGFSPWRPVVAATMPVDTAIVPDGRPNRASIVLVVRRNDHSDRPRYRGLWVPRTSSVGLTCCFVMGLEVRDDRQSWRSDCSTSSSASSSAGSRCWPASRPPRTPRSSFCDTRSRSCADRSPGPAPAGRTAPCPRRWPGYCPRSAGAIDSWRRRRCCAGIESWSDGTGPDHIVRPGGQRFHGSCAA